MRRVLSVFTLFMTLGFVATAAQEQPSSKALQSAAGECTKLEAGKAALLDEKNSFSTEDKRLQQEDSDLKAEVNRIRRSKMDFKMDADALQDDMHKYNAECGGSHPRSVYEQLRPKCEPWGKKIDDKTTSLDQRARDMSGAQNKVDTRQANLSNDTLKLTQKKKDNDAKMADVTAKLNQAQMRTIALALKDPTLRQRASEACKKSTSGEQLQCCNSVVWDAADPSRCGVALVYQVLKTGGVFGTAVVVPVK
ncbi:MAG: hypothetical protein LAP21_15640 [Acidobacteriia bacterium]|nr:hypothetical protein [Terriglobia bacterium]